MPALTPPTRPSASFQALSESKIMRDYQDGFQKVTGMVLHLRDASGSPERTEEPWTGNNEFCALMADLHPACDECLKLQKRLANVIGTEPTTLTCFAGMCETAVPVRVGNELIAFLETGHVFCHPPAKKAFTKLARTLLDLGTKFDAKRAEEKWLATKVVTAEQYQAFVTLLQVFARHLETCGAAMQGAEAHSAGVKSAAVEKAKQFIANHLAEDLTLSEVAKVVNLSAQYFCNQFRQCTGMTFVDYVSRIRVEKARQLLGRPDLRISEIGFQAGFQSISQFNRVFRRHTGTSPTEYRHQCLQQAASPQS